MHVRHGGTEAWPAAAHCGSQGVYLCDWWQELEREYESASELSARAERELEALQQEDRNRLLRKVVDLQHEAELGELGIREFGECLLAVENVVVSLEKDSSDGAPGRSGSAAGSRGGSQKRSARNVGGKLSQRLLALATPSGPAAVAAAANTADKKPGRGLRSHGGVEAAPSTDEVIVISKGGAGRSKGGIRTAGQVVTVVKRPSKRWNTMLGSYTGPVHT